jgi:hypothetical protein
VRSRMNFPITEYNLAEVEAEPLVLMGVGRGGSSGPVMSGAASGQSEESTREERPARRARHNRWVQCTGRARVQNQLPVVRYALAECHYPGKQLHEQQHRWRAACTRHFSCISRATSHAGGTTMRAVRWMMRRSTTQQQLEALEQRHRPAGQPLSTQQQ